MSEVPPHFHKDNTIFEGDIIPDGAYVTVVPDWPAQEGREVTYFDSGSSDFRRYRMVDGVWRVIGQAATGGASWQMLESGSLDGVGSLDIDGLTGDTQKLYRLTMRISFTTADKIHVRFNGVSAAEYLHLQHRSGFLAGADNHSNVNVGNSLQTEMYLNDGDFIYHDIELKIYAESTFPRKITGRNFVSTDADNYMLQEVGGIWTDTTDEITEINITGGQNFITGSEYWFEVLS